MSEKPVPATLHWDIEDSHPVLLNQIQSALRKVMDPEIGLDILQLGLIRNVSISEDVITVKMILTTPYCPYGPSLLESARMEVETASGKTTRMDFSLEPWDLSMMEDGVMPDWGIY